MISSWSHYRQVNFATRADARVVLYLGSVMVLRPCLDCRKLSPNSRCVECARAKDRARGTTTQRGLGWQHQQQRRVQLEAVPYCEDCGHTGSEGNPLTGEHGVPRVQGGRRVTRTLCRRCNSTQGARIGHAGHRGAGRTRL